MLGRRQLMTRAAALAATQFLAGSLHARPAASRVRTAVDPFALGVASGEPSADGFVLWTRIAGLGEDRLVGYEIAEDDGFRRIVRRGTALAPLARGGAVHLEAYGLEAGRRYFYRFHFGEAVSRTGTVTTIAAAPDRLRLALTSCQHWEQGWFTAYRDMIANGVEAVLQVGDYIYERSFGKGPGIRSFGEPDPVTLGDYRARHALYRSDPDLSAVHAAMPFLVSWDDHEVENDYFADRAGYTGDPKAFVDRRAAAYRAYFEHMPLRPSALHPRGEVRLYRSSVWGDLAAVHVLDTRQYRTPSACVVEGATADGPIARCARPDSDQGSMLGHVQEAWFKQATATRPARWSLVTQQTLFSRLALPAGADSLYPQFWDGYAAARTRLLDALDAAHTRNAVILGGDVHSFWINDVKRDFTRPERATVATEIVTSCLASRSGPEALFGPAPDLNPHVRFRDNAHAGYVLLDIRSDRIEGAMRAVSDLADPRATCRTLRSFAIEDRRPGASL
jgi:alkaline phosphatase D